LLLACLFPFASLVSMYSNEVLMLWTRNPNVAAHAAPIVSVFILGTALNGAMHFPYALQLAYGVTRLPLTINAVLLFFTVPSTVLLAYKYGAIGGASSWALINILYVAVGTWLTHRSLLPGIALKWLVFDVGIPLALSISVVGGVSMIAHSYTANLGVLISIGVLSCIAGAALIAVTATGSRALLYRLARGKSAQIGAA
jgi:O-antigen/teichoic acid export membrane protein